MATKIVDNRLKNTKLFDELCEGDMFFLEGDRVLKMKTYNISDNTGEICTNTVDIIDGTVNYTPISAYVIPVNVTITIE